MKIPLSYLYDILPNTTGNMDVYDNNRNVLEELKTVSLVIRFYEILENLNS